MPVIYLAIGCLACYVLHCALAPLRNPAKAPANKSFNEMGPDEAAAILGIAPDAPPEEIKCAHASLMQKLHPDHGGTDYLASQLNRAKEILLEQSS